MQEQYPPTQKHTSAMICNLCMKMKKLEMEHPNINDIPGVTVRRLFDLSSMEHAPEKYYQDPVMSEIYAASIIEALAGTGNNHFKVVQVMNKMKEKLLVGYKYHVYKGEDHRPRGVWQSSPSQQYKYIRFGDVVACDGQLKCKNSLGWIYWSMSGTNGEKLENFCDALTLVECDHFQVWAIRKTYETSDRPLNTIKVIAMDGKLSEEYLRSEIPGKNTRHITCIYISQAYYPPIFFRTSPDCLIVRDHYHLKSSIWPKQLGEIFIIILKNIQNQH